MVFTLVALGAGLLAIAPAGAEELPHPAADPVDFVNDVQPILRQSCFACHGPLRARGGLRLDLRQAAMQGGDSGPAIVPGKSSESPLIRFVSGLEPDRQMPPEGKKITARQVSILRRWIDDGAAWPQKTDDNQADDPREWWSLRPIHRPSTPHLEFANRGFLRTPIDAFVVQKLQREGLTPNPRSDRRTYLKRVMFDLHGLPPSRNQWQSFQVDSLPDAEERLLDELLASPRYGERWARHWLDVSHYADSHGQDQDRPRPNAWPFRDYVIRALNQDKPYADFVAEQVAGDVLRPSDPQAIAATGFLAAGPFDESSLVSIREDSIDRLIGQYLDRDDIVTTTMSAFTGMTVGCARCHDHKFDPIDQQDYYALQAVFAGIDKAERRYDVDPEVAAKRQMLRTTLEKVRGWKGQTPDELLTAERQQAVQQFIAQRENVQQNWTLSKPTQWEAKQGSVLKLQPDQSLLAEGNRPERDTYRILLETDQKSITGLRLEVLDDDSLPMRGPGRQDNGNLHLSEIRVTAHPRGRADAQVSVKMRRAVADFDQDGWDITRAIDGNPSTAWGIFPAVGKAHEAAFAFAQSIEFEEGVCLAVELDQLHGGGHLLGRVRLAVTAAAQPEASILRPLPAEIREVLQIQADARTATQRAEFARWIWEQELSHALESLPPESRVFCGTNQFIPDGTFRPATSPRPVHVLARGNVSQPLELAPPGALQAVSGLTSRFALPDNHREGDRRVALARWLTDDNNPLTWRVIVNRIWHYHFGRGLVDSPNDLGRMGSDVTHPDLLDWMADDFRESGGGSWKRLHRQLLLSHTFSQTTADNRLAAERDADNRWLWRMNRGRIDAESFRDAVLFASGKLDLTMSGPPVMHFIMSPGIHVTPNADYQQFDVDQAQANRRAIYRYVFRTRPDPLLEMLDCPDFSQSTPVRASSVSPLQALSLWNNKLVLRHAEHCAALAAQAAEAAQAGANLKAQVQALAQQTLCRDADRDELSDWEEYARIHGLANLARVLLNSSEFLFID